MPQLQHRGHRALPSGPLVPLAWLDRLNSDSSRLALTVAVSAFDSAISAWRSNAPPPAAALALDLEVLIELWGVGGTPAAEKFEARDECSSGSAVVPDAADLADPPPTPACPADCCCCCCCADNRDVRVPTRAMASSNCVCTSNAALPAPAYCGRAANTAEPAIAVVLAIELPSSGPP